MSKQPQTQTLPSENGLLTLDMINDVHRKVMDASPIYGFLLANLEITSVSPGQIEATLPVTRNMINSHSILHGSTSATIIDWIGGIVVASTSPERASKRGLSVDIHASYVGSAKEGDVLLISGRSTKVGRNLAFINVEIRARPANGGDARVVVTGSHTKFVG